MLINLICSAFLDPTWPKELHKLSKTQPRSRFFYHHYKTDPSYRQYWLRTSKSESLGVRGSSPRLQLSGMCCIWTMARPKWRGTVYWRKS